jgi:phage terminase large subunit GpA-like protein
MAIPTPSPPPPAEAGHAEPLWSDVEREAWRPVKRLRPSAWAERNRVLRRSSRPGPWRNRNAPALVGLMDLCVRRGVREIWIKKAAQVGASESVRNVIGCLAHQEPAPMLLVLPSEKDGKKIVRVEILPLFTDTPVLARLYTGRSRDRQLTQIILSNGFDLSLGWSGSASSLASHPYRCVVLDETDKYDQTTADEAPPVELARVRTRTYGDRGLIIGLSTPTTTSGVMHREFESCPRDARFYFFVPCPDCGKFQRLLPDRITWEKFPDEQLEPKELAARVRRRGLAWYECAGCGSRIDDGQKPAMLWAGYWGNEAGSFKLFTDGREEGQFPETDRIGLHYPATNDLSTKFTDIAAEWIRARGDPGKIRQLRNSTLAETYEPEITVTSSGVFDRKSREAETRGWAPMVVPAWAMLLLMTVDTQVDHFWFVIRAWGHAFRSRRVHHGKVLTFDELTMLADQRLWAWESNVVPPQRVLFTGIDSGGGKDYIGGSRTDQVYQWCLKDPHRRYALKGLSKAGDRPIWSRKRTYTPPGVGRSPYDYFLTLFHSHHFNDLLASAIGSRVPGPDPKTGELTEEAGEDLWQLNAANDGEYNAHLSNMTKKTVRVTGGRARYEDRWEPRTSGARVDYRACEYMQFAMAHGPAAVGGLPSPETWEAMRKARETPRNVQYTNPLTSHKGRY